MKKYSIREIQEKYDLELDKIISQIKKLDSGTKSQVSSSKNRERKQKFILLQFPDGLKPYATTIINYLEESTRAQFLIWFGSCYGACDTPILPKHIENKIDLVIQFGHNEMMPRF